MLYLFIKLLSIFFFFWIILGCICFFFFSHWKLLRRTIVAVNKRNHNLFLERYLIVWPVVKQTFSKVFTYMWFYSNVILCRITLNSLFFLITQFVPFAMQRLYSWPFFFSVDNFCQFLLVSFEMAYVCCSWLTDWLTASFHLSWSSLAVHCFHTHLSVAVFFSLYFSLRSFCLLSFSVVRDFMHLLYYAILSRTYTVYIYLKHTFCHCHYLLSFDLATEYTERKKKSEEIAKEK